MQKGLDTKLLVTNISAALVTSLLVLCGSVCAATFIFSGKLSIFLPAGIGIALISSIIVNGIISSKGSFPATIAGAAIVPAAIMGVMAQAIYTEIERQSTEVLDVVTVALPTILFSITLVSIVTSVILLMMGWFKLGKLIRFIPYPVMGGFLAGVGWLLVEGSINVMRRVALPLGNQWNYFFNVPTLTHVLPGVALAILILVMQRKTKHYLVFPTLILSGIALFYIILMATGTSVSEAREAGWLMESFSTKDVWGSYNVFHVFSNVDWRIIPTQLSNLFIIMAVSIISLLLSATGIEASLNNELDLDKELRVSGGANLLSGLLGGVISYHFILYTKANYEAGSRSRLTGLLTTLILSLVALFAAAAVVTMIPKPVLGALLLYFGFGLLYDWVISSWSRFTTIDYTLTVTILIAIASFGFLPGVVLGIALSVIVFVYQNSKVKVIKHTLSGADRKSNVERNFTQKTFLGKEGSKITIISLQSYIFFGTAHSLYGLIKDMLEKGTKQKPDYLIFDFRFVNGLDSSAGHSFIKIKNILYEHQCELIFSALQRDVKNQLETIGCIERVDDRCQLFNDLDHAIEWCENRLLESSEIMVKEQTPITRILQDWFNNEDTAQSFLKYLEQKKIPIGHYLFRQGDDADEIYI